MRINILLPEILINTPLWNLINNIIIQNWLIIELIKVKAYSNNYFNDYVDNLCKVIHTSEHFIKINNTN